MAAAPGGFPQLDPESTVKQFREFLSSYNKLSEQCFQDCVHDFTTRKVLDGELFNKLLREVSETDSTDLTALPGVSADTL
ncbi:mitochondrial import inner membrane translocase subunit Tim9-like isoform X2 [Haliotis rubra]|uniref:mitochondrial import inner membrane translocase subunit Tim9-like isoform X2 n=1 Tax=Haliotis rubra TaxID=36100 RepID=UPI001EE60872|nr:mitochondrial import inner membrane translocase subunit Tim9-like isoform X2 [Haliotis rubra]